MIKVACWVDRKDASMAVHWAGWMDVLMAVCSDARRVVSSVVNGAALMAGHSGIGLVVLMGESMDVILVVAKEAKKVVRLVDVKVAKRGVLTVVLMVESMDAWLAAE